MTNHGEHIPILEIVSDSQANDYLRAVVAVCAQNRSVIPGLSYESNESLTATDRSMRRASWVTLDSVTEADNQPVQTRVLRYLTGPHDETTIAQTMPNVPTLDVDLRRWRTKTSDKINYSIASTVDAAGHIAIRKAATEDERKDAEALFITMTADFKTQLERTLANRPEMLQAIERGARSPQELDQQHKRHGFLGRLLLRKT